MHQKSNKFKFKMQKNIANENSAGYGLVLFDTGILIEDSEFKSNEYGGINVLSAPLKTEKPLSEEIRSFLERFPMVVQIKRCDIVQNNRTGLQVEDFWKGPIILEETKFSFNKYSGIILSASDYPADP